MNPSIWASWAFYLEALDRDVRKAHEQPAIGVLLCASKNDEVAEYALRRSLSPALISEYQTQLPDKKLLQAKLHEFTFRTCRTTPDSALIEAAQAILSSRSEDIEGRSSAKDGSYSLRHSRTRAFGCRTAWQ